MGHKLEGPRLSLPAKKEKKKPVGRKGKKRSAGPNERSNGNPSTPTPGTSSSTSSAAIAAAAQLSPNGSSKKTKKSNVVEPSRKSSHAQDSSKKPSTPSVENSKKSSPAVEPSPPRSSPLPPIPPLKISSPVMDSHSERSGADGAASPPQSLPSPSSQVKWKQKLFSYLNNT